MIFNKYDLFSSYTMLLYSLLEKILFEIIRKICTYKFLKKLFSKYFLNIQTPKHINIYISDTFSKYIKTTQMNSIQEIIICLIYNFFSEIL